MSSGGGGPTGILRRVGEARKKKLSKKREGLRTDITESETLSDITKSELVSQLEKGTGQISDVSKTFAAAKEGLDPKFKSRQFAKQRESILSDRPGRAQTVLTR